MTKEKRKNVRRTMHYGARIASEDGSPLRDCRVSDVSETGARLDLEHPEMLPETFTLLLSGRGGIQRRCVVMWRSNGQIGVQFEKSAPPR